MGELVCNELCSLVGTEPATAESSNADPLEIWLFPTREEYLAAAQSGSHGLSPSLSLGHYSPAERRSRLFLPEGRDGFERMSETFAHELTHHWLDQRFAPPAAGPRARAYDGRTPGFWIVEGFAELVAEFLYDIRRGRVDRTNPRAHSLDVVASADPSRLVSWDLLFRMPHVALPSLGVRDQDPLTLRWSLGRFLVPNEVSMFYAQAAATCHYLLRSEQVPRTALREFVHRYYRGTATEADVKQVLGITPAELGARVRAFAAAQR
jgi:hypothetical protein